MPDLYFTGFCVKARKIDSDEDKIFINVCTTDDIPPPEDISEQRLIEILASDEPSEYRVPMSIGQGRPVHDKTGNPATAYDIAINSQFLQKMESNELFKRFFLNVAFEGLEDKYQIRINTENFCILKNRKIMGSLQLHCIQDREMMKKMGKEKKLIEVMDVPVGDKKHPPYKLQRDDVNGVDCLIADLFMPDVTKSNINIQVNDERLVVDTMKPSYFLDIFFPMKINWNETKSRYDTTNGVRIFEVSNKTTVLILTFLFQFLTVTMPVM